MRARIRPKFAAVCGPSLLYWSPNLGRSEPSLGRARAIVQHTIGGVSMNYFEIVAAPFARPGIAPEAALAAAVASTAKDLVERRVLLHAPSLFEPDLTAGLSVVVSSALGGSRLIGAVEAYHRINPPLLPQPIRNVGSLVLWELEAPHAAAQTRKLRDHARELSQTAFDSCLCTRAEAALVVAHPEVLELSRSMLSKFLARAVIFCADSGVAIGTVRDFESSSRAVASLRRVIDQGSRFRFAGDAVDALQNLTLDHGLERRHHRVKIAKLSALFCAGRRALDGGSEAITASDVIAARDMVYAGEGCQDLPSEDAETHEQEDALFERVMRAFGRSITTEVPVSAVQIKVRRSRRHGSMSVPDLLEGLARRGKLQIIEFPRIGPGTGGRPARIVVLPPAPLALPPPTRLALPAPTLLPAA